LGQATIIPPGFGRLPQEYLPLADALSKAELKEMLEDMKRIKSGPLKHLPDHDKYLAHICGV
jgi:hypothetical protein